MAERLRRGPTVLTIAATLVIVFVVGYIWCFRWAPTTTLLIVRHADRVPNQDALTQPQGVARAQELAHVGAKAGVVAIYHSNTVRTQDTAVPLAAALGLTPVVYPANDVAALVSQIFTDHRGGKVFVVGHSDTVPQIIAAAGGPTLPNIDGSEFDNLFVLTTCRCLRSGASLVNLQYGAASP